MKWRRITEDEMAAVLKNPDLEEPYYLKPIITDAYKRMGKRYLCVSYIEQEGNYLIISVVDKND